MIGETTVDTSRLLVEVRMKGSPGNDGWRFHAVLPRDLSDKDALLWVQALNTSDEYEYRVVCEETVTTRVVLTPTT